MRFEQQVKPTPVVPLERVKEEVYARAGNIQAMRVILDCQQQQRWSDEQAFGLMACYLADSLESMTKKVMEATNRQIVDPIEVIRDGDTVRHAFLPNAAREMYDALKDFVAITEGNGAVKNKALAAIAKAEGR
jgi:hypothetical protein